MSLAHERLLAVGWSACVLIGLSFQRMSAYKSVSMFCGARTSNLCTKRVTAHINRFLWDSWDFGSSLLFDFCNEHNYILANSTFWHKEEQNWCHPILLECFQSKLKAVNPVVILNLQYFLLHSFYFVCVFDKTSHNGILCNTTNLSLYRQILWTAQRLFVRGTRFNLNSSPCVCALTYLYHPLKRKYLPPNK